MYNNTYSYHEAAAEDIRRYIADEINLADFSSVEELDEHLNEVLWTEDSVTGNASGSYTFSTYKAEENLCHNLDLLAEALQEFGCGLDYLLNKGAEAADVTIRCYVLSACIAQVVEEYAEEITG